MYYSKADEKALLYTWGILIPVIFVCIFFGVNYNAKQVDNKLKSEGITIQAVVTDVYVTNAPRVGDRYYAVLEYDYMGKHFSNTLQIIQGYCQKNNRVLLRRLKNSDSESYMKIIGVNN